MIYTVHVQPNDHDAANARFVRDGFSWAALVFGPLWLAYHRIWHGLIGWVIVASALYGLARLLHLPESSAALLSELLSLYLGFEGNGLLRAALERRTWPVLDVAYGRKLEDAELSFYQRFARSPRAADVRQPPIGTMPKPQDDFLGLFPQAAR